MENLPWISTDSVNIDRYFTKVELENLCDYEKLRLKNMKRNYETMQLLGFPIQKPHFMLSKREQAKIRRRDEAALAKDEDVDWTPQLEREQENQGKEEAPKPMVWKPPPLKIKKSIPESTVVKSRSGKGCYLDDSDDEEFEGYSFGDIEAAEKRYNRKLKRSQCELAKLKSSNLELDEEEDETSHDTLLVEPTRDKTKDSQAAKGCSEEGKRRYPSRNIVRRNYTEMEVPDDDHYIFCDDCNTEYEGDCPVHGPLVVIKDTEVKAVDLKPGVYRCHLSVPSGLVIKPSSIPSAGAGVWAEAPVPKGVRFGPYEGVIVEDSEDAHSGYCWQIYKQGKPHHYVDAADKNESNWMRYVNCACREEDQNLLAFQFHGEIFYRTIENVTAQTELLVWYGDEYGQELGITREDFVTNKQNNYRCSSGDSACDVCGQLFSRDVYMMTHRQHKHPLADISNNGRRGLYKCKLCLFSDDNVDSFQQHLAAHQTKQWGRVKIS
ncbi:hypothetical protein NP493_660g02003 [Ridgeia piscesae]|uniref:Histone-lysine N-methyltransferase PRDM9 n=1 Tax=Ridgeia piscesae TaxID=27915 RepID=A0AAD9NN67_RIDPI|nr:hypothetical protein NP493_660g02003 [Ridgeia piscesae]